MLTRQKKLEALRHGFAFLQAYVDPGGSLNLTDINVHAEEFVRNVLNGLYGWELENCNRTSSNAPCIDLMDSAREIAVQVTGERGSGKINDTLKCMSGHCMGQSVSQLYFMLLNKRQKSYTVNEECDGVAFSPDQDVLDFTALLHTLQTADDATLARVHDYVAGQLPQVTSATASQRSTVELLLLNPVERYQLQWNPMETGQLYSSPESGDRSQLKTHGALRPVFRLKNVGTQGAQEVKVRWTLSDEIDLSDVVRSERCRRTGAAFSAGWFSHHLGGVGPNAPMTFRSSCSHEEVTTLDFVRHSEGDDSCHEVMAPPSLWSTVEAYFFAETPLFPDSQPIFVDLRVELATKRPAESVATYAVRIGAVPIRGGTTTPGVPPRYPEDFYVLSLLTFEVVRT
jgi:hypothetical protein